MSAGDPILVVIDPTTNAQPALAKAAALAGHLGSKLMLLACIYDQYVAGERFYDGPDLVGLRANMVNDEFQTLQALAGPLRNEGLSVQCNVVWDHPLHEAIVREALRVEPSFVVKETHEHSSLSRTLFTNTDWHLIRECPFALWLVKPGPMPDHATVMAAVDPTHEHDEQGELDRRIIEQAQLLSVMFEERLHLVHTFDLPSAAVITAFSSAPASASPPPAYERLTTEIGQMHTAAFERLTAGIGFPADQLHLYQGGTDKLPDIAEDLRADIVVMGAVARSRLQRAIMGSTAEMTLDRFPCDVVIVKPTAFVSPIEANTNIYARREKVPGRRILSCAWALQKRRGGAWNHYPAITVDDRYIPPFSRKPDRYYDRLAATPPGIIKCIDTENCSPFSH